MLVGMAVPLVERSSSLQVAVERLASLLTGGGTGLADPAGSRLEFESEIVLRPLERAVLAPAEVWAVDGGQAVVADARCLQLVVARAARVRYRLGACDVEDEGDLRAWLLGGDEDGAVAAGLGLGIAADAAVDLNLLRDVEEWRGGDRGGGGGGAGGLGPGGGGAPARWGGGP